MFFIYSLDSSNGNHVDLIKKYGDVMVLKVELQSRILVLNKLYVKDSKLTIVCRDQANLLQIYEDKEFYLILYHSF